MSRPIVLITAMAVGALTSCGDADSYAAAEDSLRSWVTAVHERDVAACGLMTADYQEEVVSTSDDCHQAVLAGDSDALRGLPPTDARMDVAAWDPSGEALVEATYDGQRSGFWLEYRGGRWLVAGPVTPTGAHGSTGP